MAVTVSYLYVCMLCLTKSFPDENSINASITILSCIGIVCYLHTIVTTGQVVVLQIFIVLSVIVQVLLGLRQLYAGHADAGLIQGQMANSGAFANYLSAIIPWLLSVVVAVDGNKRLIKIAVTILMAAAIVLVVFTQARAAFSGITIGSVYVFFSLSKKRLKRPRPLVIVICILSIPVMVLALYRLKPASALGRMTIYNVCLNIIRDYPLPGVGVNRFGAVYNNYQSAYFRTSDQPVATQLLAADVLEAYNIVIQILTEYGFIGLFLFMWILYEVTRLHVADSCGCSSTWQHAGSAGSLLAVFVAGLFSNPFHVSPVILLVLYHISIVVQPKPALQDKPAKKYYLPVIVVLLCTIAAWWVVQNYKAEKNWVAAATAARINDFAKASRLYTIAYPARAHNGDFLFNYGAEACIAGDYGTAIEQLEHAKQYSSLSSIRIFLADAFMATQQYPQAEENYLTAIYTTPAHIYPKYKLVQLYKRWGKPGLARQWARETLQYPVKIPSELSASLLQSLKEDTETKGNDY